MVHVVVGFEHIGRLGLALEDNQMGRMFLICRILVRLIVERGDLGGAAQFRRYEITVEVLVMLGYRSCPRGKHRHRGLSGVVETLDQFVEYPVCGHAPVVESAEARPVLAYLQFVAEAPYYDARTVAVALYPFGDESVPQIGERLASAPAAVVAPFVYQLVDDDHSDSVGNPREAVTIRIVRAAYRVISELFQP